MKIVFEMPAHKLEEVRYITSIARETNSEDIGFVLVTNGKELSNRNNWVERNLVIQYFDLKITEPCVSMAEIRSYINEVATKHFQPQYRILADSNFQFNGDWEGYILEAVQDMQRFSAITNRECYMGMGGSLGSYGHGTKPFLGPQPLFPTGRGIIYTYADVYDSMQKLPSSLEEQYMVSILFQKGQVPLRKMMSPIYHRHINTNVGIHDKELIDQYNSEMVRRLWNDPNWKLKPTFGTTDKVTNDGRYYSLVPKNAMKAMARLKSELSRIPGVDEFTRTW